MWKSNEGGPRDTIILYVESGNAPLAVEVPDGAGVGVGAGAWATIGGAGAAIGGAGASVGSGARAATGGDGVEEEFDWLNEGLEGEDFVDDIFDAAGPSNVPPPNIDLDEEWAELALEDDIASVDSSDDEQGPGNLEFNERTDMENVRLAKGMKFPNSQVFRKALREYVIQNHIDVKWKLNEKKKISVHYKNNCGWRCYASMVTGECTFEIKTLYPKCTSPLSFKNGQVTSAYVAKRYLEDFGKNPNWEVSGVKHHVMQKILVDLSLSHVYRSRKAARGLITGNEEAQYGLLRDYAELILRTDVGSRVGFLDGCRPFVGLDGCHLKGKFGGQLLSATAKDGNDNIFLVAMAVVEQENKDSWTWFLEQFADDIGRPNELNLVFISDRQKGLLLAMETLFPTVEHRYCVKYIYNNFKVNHKGMKLKSARDKPILSMLEWIRVRLMSRLYIKKAGIEKYGGNLCPSIQKKLEQLKLECKSFCAVPSKRFVYEVDNERERHVVDLVNRTSSCRVWDLTGIPCKHGVATIIVNREKLEDYTHPCYYKDAYVETYKTPIPPMPG
ncbi:uncharacterized protein LOC115990099 [Quercus lobata]|uniref:uncharacterized protein LOC115990099 n=1 Tax=Quercus lobata TaxID=97700 RepID=UPI0012462A0B|nr:uncharacterized protein LOC115990099 [Quercus lobata]